MNLRLKAMGGGAACLIFAAACGGSAESSGKDLGGLAGSASETGGNSGIGGSGGSDDATGGKTSTGGKASTGGQGIGGSSGGVTAAGGAETGGAATGGVGLAGAGGEGETGGTSSGGSDTGGTGGVGTGGVGTGGTGTGGVGTGGTGGITHSIGCADGQREGFVDLDKYPNIASCSGAWKVAGIAASVTASLTPSCNRQSGDDSANLDGTGCNVSDLCEAGWHVCTTTTDVTEHLGESGSCTDSVDSKTQEMQFFATRQAGPGYTMCGAGENDLFGCGTLGNAASDNCGPLELYGGDGCWALGAPWSCASGLTETVSVTKSTSARGGVMCCRD